MHLGRRHPIDLGLIGDIASTLEVLIPLLELRTERSFLDDALAHRDKAYEKLGHKAVAHSGAVHPQFLTELLASHAVSDAIWTGDGGSPMVWCLRHVPSTGRNRTLASREFAMS